MCGLLGLQPASCLSASSRPGLVYPSTSRTIPGFSVFGLALCPERQETFSPSFPFSAVLPGKDGKRFPEEMACKQRLLKVASEERQPRQRECLAKVMAAGTFGEWKPFRVALTVFPSLLLLSSLFRGLHVSQPLVFSILCQPCPVNLVTNCSFPGLTFGVL